MNQIGFTNFRKFQNFPTIDLGDITILVGGNNAGKSTLVKAMLLMRDFLKSRIESVEKSNNIFSTFEPKFSFDSEHVNIGDFYRAFCHQSPSKENTISFTMKIEQFKFVVNIRGERKPGVIPNVTMIAVSDENVDFIFDFSKDQMTAQFGNDKKELFNNLFSDKQDLENEIKQYTVRLHELFKHLSNCVDLEIITETKTEIERLQLKLKQAQSKLSKNSKDIEKRNYKIKVFGSRAVNMYFYKGLESGKLLIPELIKGFAKFADEETVGDKRTNSYKEEEANRTFIKGKVSQINAIAEEIEKVLNKQEIEYIYAHSVYQDSVYAKCANSSDYTKRTIHEFYTSRISPGDEEFSFIEEWLEKFNIGTSLKVVPFKGDNYSLVIYDKENPEIKSEKKKGYPGGIDLADKGMGSIQLVVLLLRIATLIRRYKGQQLTILLEVLLRLLQKNS